MLWIFNTLWVGQFRVRLVRLLVPALDNPLLVHVPAVQGLVLHLLLRQVIVTHQNKDDPLKNKPLLEHVFQVFLTQILKCIAACTVICPCVMFLIRIRIDLFRGIHSDARPEVWIQHSNLSPLCLQQKDEGNFLLGSVTIRIIKVFISARIQTQF